MVANLLITAKKYAKENKWNEAINILEQIMNETEGNCDPEVYTLYAKSLRVISKTDEAKNILTKGSEQHPENERILREFLHLYDSIGDWHASESIALSLININSKKAEYHFLLGRIYSFLNDFQKAEEAYRIGLQHRHQKSFEELMEIVQSGFADDVTKVSSEYTFIGGKNNLGAFIHQYGDRKFFTKISKSIRDARREVTFYKNICSDYPHLNEIVPSYIDSKVIDKIIYLTIEMIEDDIPIKVGHVDKIITTASQISKIKYQDIVKKYTNPNYPFILRNRPTSVVVFFTQIHKKYYNERLFSSFYRLLEQNNYPKSVSEAIQKLESLVMDNKLYLFIKPEEHYSLLHGDFLRQNIKIKKENEMPIIFDWGIFNVGPHFIDIARYLSSIFLPYSEVKRIYLFNDERGTNLSLIEKIFFLYAMSLFYILLSGNKSMNERLSDFIIPAINDMEVLISQFKKNELIEVVESFSIDKKEEELKNSELKKKTQTLKKEMELENNKLNKEIQMLKKENRSLQTKFNDMLNSKSWRLTAPLRKIVEWTKVRKKR